MEAIVVTVYHWYTLRPQWFTSVPRDSPPSNVAQDSSNHGIWLRIYDLIICIRSRCQWDSLSTVLRFRHLWNKKTSYPPFPHIPNAYWRNRKPHNTRHCCLKKGNEACITVTCPWQFGNPAGCMLAGFSALGGNVPWWGPCSVAVGVVP